MAKLLEIKFPRFRYDPKRAEELFVQFSDSQSPLRRGCIPVGFGVSGNILWQGVGVSSDIANQGSPLVVTSSCTGIALYGGSLDLSIGGGDTEMTIGVSKYTSIGILLSTDDLGALSITGIAFHIGAGVSLPITFSNSEDIWSGY
jgi:hypothetical protein